MSLDPDLTDFQFLAITTTAFVRIRRRLDGEERVIWRSDGTGLSEKEMVTLAFAKPQETVIADARRVREIEQRWAEEDAAADLNELD